MARTAGSTTSAPEESAASQKHATVPFVDQPIDPFFNANRPEDLETAAALLKAAPG